jgi:hypothetical protein
VADSIYWVNSGLDFSIRGAPLAGSGTVETLYDSAHVGSQPYGLAIEAAAGRIYWTNRDFNDPTILRAPLAPHGSVETLYDKGDGVKDPTGIAIHPAAGRIYWSNAGDNTIRRAPLAPHGTVETLYGSAEGVLGPAGLAIDPAAGRIYWANAGDSTIRSAPLAPHGDVAPLYGPQGESNPWWVAIDAAAGRIYWTYWYAFADGRIRGARIYSGRVKRPPTFRPPTIDTLYDSVHGVSFPGGLAIDPNPAEPGPERLELERDTGSYPTGGWLGDALDWARDLFPRPTASPGLIYWGNGRTTTGGQAPNPNDQKIQRGPLAGSATPDTLYRSSPPASADPVSFPAGLALLRAPIGTVPPTIGWQFVLTGGPPPGPHFGPPVPDFDHLEQVLACSPGTWAPDLLGSFLYRAPQSFTYQWIRNGTNLTDPPDPTKPHYTPTTAGSYSCRVTATNRAGSATQTSAAFTVTSGMLP